MNIIILVICI